MRLCAIIAVIAMLLPASAAVADGCPKPSDDIATDRPDVTNSSIVVPVGSLQNENGINLSSRSDELVLDGTNSRLRLGVAPCLELLVDLPTYFSTIRGQAGSGFSNVTPAVKWQISPMPGTLDLSATVGVGLPTGATNIAGPGVQPYLQFPWSRELACGWSFALDSLASTFPENAQARGFGRSSTLRVTNRDLASTGPKLSARIAEYFYQRLAPAVEGSLLGDITAGHGIGVHPTRDAAALRITQPSSPTSQADVARGQWPLRP
jgi:hypothetical protein